MLEGESDTNFSLQKERVHAFDPLDDHLKAVGRYSPDELAFFDQERLYNAKGIILPRDSSAYEIAYKVAKVVRAEDRIAGHEEADNGQADRYSYLAAKKKIEKILRRIFLIELSYQARKALTDSADPDLAATLARSVIGSKLSERRARMLNSDPAKNVGGPSYFPIKPR